MSKLPRIRYGEFGFAFKFNIIYDFLNHIKTSIKYHVFD